MTFYGALANTASRLLRDKGQDMILRRESVASFDPVTGTLISSPPVDFVVYGILVEQDTRLIDAGVVQIGSKKAIIEAVGVSPTIDDKLVANGKTWSIISVEEISPAGEAVIYKLVVML